MSDLTTLVQNDDQGNLVTTSEAIAEGARVEHRAVLQTLTKYATDFERFGRVAFEMRSGELRPQGGTGRATRVAILNEHQATLLLTYAKNTDQVRRFKADLVEQFYRMAQQIQERRPKLEQVTRLELAQMIVEAEQSKIQAEKRAEALQSYAGLLEPKAEAYDHFMEADGTYSVGSVAKMLGRSQNKLFDLLRNSGVLISKGAMRNTPYQQYMHHFSVKAYEFERTDGTRGTSYTTRIQPSGVDFIRRKLGIPSPVTQ